MILQLYLHFPFCKRKCFYCDFCSAQASTQTVAAYCSALQKEICMIGEKYAGAHVNTVFLGGGTPSLAPPDALAGVLRTLGDAFDILPDAEFTSEANPGTLTREWLDAAMAHGLNRLSLGVQAAQDELLRRIGRIHTFSEAQEAVALARACGIQNLNLDVMSGLPGQTPSDYQATLEQVHALSPEHISAYSLILEPGTQLWREVEAGREVLPGDDAAAEMYERGTAWLQRAGYGRYEVSNFARPGFECRHNIGYWQGEWYLGLGVAAHSMLPPDGEQSRQGAVRIRHANEANVDAYIRALEAGRLPPSQTELIGANDAMFETMMVGLRMVEGVSERRFEALHAVPLAKRYGEALDRLCAEKLGRWYDSEIGGRRFALTPHGMEVQNEVLLRLMP